MEEYSPYAPHFTSISKISFTLCPFLSVPLGKWSPADQLSLLIMLTNEISETDIKSERLYN